MLMFEAGLGEKSDQRGIEVQLSLNEWEFFLLGLTRVQHASYCNLIFAFPLKYFYCMHQWKNQLVLNIYATKKLYYNIQNNRGGSVCYKTKYTRSLELWKKRWSGKKVGLDKVTRSLEKQRVNRNTPQPQQLLEASSKVKWKQVSTKGSIFFLT